MVADLAEDMKRNLTEIEEVMENHHDLLHTETENHMERENHMDRLDRLHHHQGQEQDHHTETGNQQADTALVDEVQHPNHDIQPKENIIHSKFENFPCLHDILL